MKIKIKMNMMMVMIKLNTNRKGGNEGNLRKGKQLNINQRFFSFFFFFFLFLIIIIISTIISSLTIYALTRLPQGTGWVILTYCISFTSQKCRSDGDNDDDEENNQDLPLALISTYQMLILVCKSHKKNEIDFSVQWNDDFQDHERVLILFFFFFSIC